MILKASQRGGGIQLAHHLLKTDDNEHVEIHEISGFVADDLLGAFKEAHAVSLGTRCKQFLFSLSLSPPETAKVPVEVFEQAIADIEAKMNLRDQPRAIVFHEKEGRRHAHCVWSRIDVDQMKAINLPHFKMKLRDISRELYLEHGWQLPCGLLNPEEGNPLNFTLEQWQQAKRSKQDPRVLKQIFQKCWAASDSQSAFTSALKERGFYLARGDRRGHVIVDWRGEVYAVSKWVGIKAKDVRAKLGDPETLPSVAETKEQVTAQFTDKLKDMAAEADALHAKAMDRLKERRSALAKKHRDVRSVLHSRQATRRCAETKDRASRLPTGLKALWFRLTGQYRKIRVENERVATEAERRDREERQQVIERQLRERRTLQREIQQQRHHYEITMGALRRDIAVFMEMSKEDQAWETSSIQNVGRKRNRRKDI